MKLFNTIFLTLSLLSLGTINTLSVQDLIDSGECPKVYKILEEIKLDLNNKNLTSLDGLEKIPHIEKVTKLDLSDNKLTELSENQFNMCAQLEDLDLSYNQINGLFQNTFNMCVSLKSINLNNNRLSILHHNQFNKLINLENINLEGNELVKLCSKTFNTLPKLKTLYLENNKINYIDTDTLYNLPVLYRITLCNNQLTQIDNIFNNLPKLSYIELNNNYLDLHEAHISLVTYLTEYRKSSSQFNFSYSHQDNPLNLAIKKFGQEKNIFNALRAREMGLQQLVHPLYVSKKRKRDSFDNESPAKRIKKS